MTRAWTFGQKLAVGFAVPLCLTMVIGGVSAVTLSNVVTDKDALVTRYAGPIHDVQRLDTLMTETMAANRGYLLTRNSGSLAQADAASQAIDQLLASLSAKLKEKDRERLDRIRAASHAYRDAMAAAVRARQAGGSAEAVAAAFERDVLPTSRALKISTACSLRSPIRRVGQFSRALPRARRP